MQKASVIDDHAWLRADRKALAGLLRDSVVLRCALSCSAVDKQRTSREQGCLNSATYNRKNTNIDRVASFERGGRILFANVDSEMWPDAALESQQSFGYVDSTETCSGHEIYLNPRGVAVRSRYPRPHLTRGDFGRGTSRGIWNSAVQLAPHKQCVM